MCKHMMKRQKKGSNEEQGWVHEPLPEYTEPEAVQRLRFRIGRSGEPRFLSHLELVNSWVRTLRRARAPLSYSQGFHAHPKITFATAPPVGEESMGDYMDVVLKERVDPSDLLARIQATLPIGIRAYEVREVPLKSPAVMALTTGFAYTLYTTTDVDKLRERVAEILSAGEILVEREGKPKNVRGRRSGRPIVQVDIRPMLCKLEVSAEGDMQAAVELEIELVGGRSIRMREIVQLLGLDLASTRILKRETFLAQEAVAANDAALVHAQAMD